jgi:hypothetical protein
MVDESKFPPMTPLRWVAICVSFVIVVCATCRLLVDFGDGGPFVRAICLPSGVILAFSICLTALGVRMGWHRR